MPPHEPTIRFTAKEIHIMIQALEIAKEEVLEMKFGKLAEIDQLREKLNKGGVK